MYYNKWFHLAFFVSILMSINSISFAEEIIDSDFSNLEKKVDLEEYNYAMEGRTDPFRPFITPKAAQPAGLDPNEIIDEQKILSGLQLFEPGQLTLVGVLNNNNAGAIALVEDQTKKGYILKQGVAIGKRGVVTQIENEQVIVTEISKTRAGKEITNTLIMKLNKEGDK